MHKETKNRYKLKVTLEKVLVEKKPKPYKKDKKVFTMFNHYRLLYNKAISLKMDILRNPDYLEIRNLKERANYIYNSNEFKEILKIAKSVKTQEKRSISLFISLLLIFFGLAGIASFYFQSAFIMLSVIPISIIFSIIFYPRISFKNFYENIFVDICIFATGLVNKRKSLSYTSNSREIKKMEKGMWLFDKKLISNRFKITTDEFNSLIEKMVIRDTVEHFSIDNGKIKVTKKKATIFSGYSFELRKNNSENYDGNVCLAFINKSTLLKTNGLTDEELSNMHQLNINNAILDSNWIVYVRNDLTVDKKLIKYIQKQVLAIENNFKTFNLYFCDNCVRLLLSIRSNREGLMTSYFDSSLSNTKQLSFMSFFSNIKALYLYSCIEKIAIYMSKYKPSIKNAWQLDFYNKEKGE